MHELIGGFFREEDQDLYESLLDFAENRGFPKLGDTSPEPISARLWASTTLL